MLEEKYYRTESHPPFINEKLTVDQWYKYVDTYDFGSIPPSKLILHHTWKPTKNSWAGLRTMRGMQNFYRGKGWSSGPHLFVAEDGIWLATPMKDVGIHAGAGNSGRNWWGGLAWYSIGVEMVGEYDTKRPTGTTWNSTLAVLDGLVNRLGLQVRSPDIEFHRDYSSKSCPGHKVQKNWVFSELNRYRANRVPFGLTVVAEPRITRETFSRVLQEGNSPARIYSPQLYRICIDQGIDPAVALAFFKHESSLGTRGLTPEYDLKNWGNVRTPEDPALGGVVLDIPNRGPFTQYQSWTSGLLDWCKRLKGPKYAGSGLHTVETIIPKYAPREDNNDEQNYIRKVREHVEGWQKSEQSERNWLVRVTSDIGLNIRQGAHRDYPKAGFLPYGATVEVTSTKDEGDPSGQFLHLADHRGFIAEAWTVRV